MSYELIICVYLLCICAHLCIIVNIMKNGLWIGIIYAVFRLLVLAAIIYYCIYEIKRTRKKNG